MRWVEILRGVFDLDSLNRGGFLKVSHCPAVQFVPVAQAVEEARRHWFVRAATLLPGKYKRMRARLAIALNNFLDETDASQRAQEEEILRRSQMPLDPSEAKAVASSLALSPLLVPADSQSR